MKLLQSFLKLIRLPNLFFIALAQILLYLCILLPITKGVHQEMEILSPENFAWLCISTIFIAAAGYIINDYFDINIDQINKPDKVVVDKIISRRWAIFFHSLFSFTGVLIGFYVGYKFGIWWIGWIHFLCTVLLFWYSISLKRKLLSGNILISFLTAWSVAFIGFAFFYKAFYGNHFEDEVYHKLLRITILYAAFAFIVSIAREVVKDMEDLQGDEKEGCKTMPVVWGLRVSKVFTAVWLIVLLASLITVQVYVLFFGWWLSATYVILFIVLPVIYLLKKLIPAQTEKDFHHISTVLKWTMFTGILSMAFFGYYAQ